MVDLRNLATNKIFMFGTDTTKINFCEEVLDLFVSEESCGNNGVYYAVEIAPDSRSDNPD